MSNFGARKHMTRKPFSAVIKRFRPSPLGVRDMLAKLERAGHIRRLAPSEAAWPVAARSEQHMIDARFATIVENCCRGAPDIAFGAAVDVLSDIAKTATAMSEEGALAVASIQAQGERIERLNEDTKRLLSELVAG